LSNSKLENLQRNHQGGQKIMDMPIGRRVEASMKLRVKARCTSERAGQRGQALVEFAFLLPLLMVILLGVIVFGVAINNYLELTNGTTAGAQALAISRGQATDPCAAVTAPFYNAAFNLTQTNVKFTITVSSPPPSPTVLYTLANNQANPSCAAATADLIQGDTATVLVTYPCNLKVFGVNFAPNPCTLTAQTAESIQ
jgi:Flp pilus assembly protein TadG